MGINMESGFKNPAKVKNQDPENHPKDGKKTPWDFTCPQYDQRSSCFVNAGTHYGVGHKQPVGTENHSSKSAVPFGRVNTMRIDEKG